MWRVGVLGYGYWGPNLVRNFFEHDRATVIQVADLSSERLEIVGKRYPSIVTTVCPDELLTNPSVDLVVIATPVSTHFELARKALENGKHVLVEKPMATSSEHCRELIRLADEKGLLLVVDHTFIFTGAVRKLKELIDSEELGDILYVESTRINLGLFQHDVNVVWDLAPHDLSILSYILGRPPDEVAAVGISHLRFGEGVEDVAYLTLRYGERTLAHLTLSWFSPVKVRQMLIGGDRKMVVYDDNENVAKLKVFDCGAKIINGNLNSRHQALVEYRRGDMSAPKIKTDEALKVEADYIIECLETGERRPVNSGEAGLAIVQTLEAIGRSMKSNGAFEAVAASMPVTV